MPGRSCRGGVWGLANGRLEHANNRGAMEANERFQASNNKCLAKGKLQDSNKKCLWPEGHFKGWKAGKRQAWTHNKRGQWRQTAGFKALRPHACGQSACSKLPRGILRVGRLERPNNRGPCRQTKGFKALTTNACGQSSWWKLPRNFKGWRAGKRQAWTP